MKSDDNLITKHYSLDVIDDVKAICKPLKKIGIKHFCYTRNYPDGSAFVLTITPELIRRAAEVFIAGMSDDGSYVNDGFYFECDMIADMGLGSYFFSFAEKFASSHHLIFYEHYKNYVEQFCFGVSPNKPEIYSFYMSNIDLFERFMVYFKDKAELLIKNGEAQRIKIPRTRKPVNDADHFDLMRRDFLSSIQHKRYFLDRKKGGVFISRREFDVILSLSCGHTFKEIASELLLSPRTVESYLANVKNKLGCFNKSQVLDIYLKSNLAKRNLA